MPREKQPEQFPHDLDTTPISVGQVWLDHYAKSKDGAQCPLCLDPRKYTAFRINSQLARLLILCYRCFAPGTTVNIKQLMEVSKRDLVKGREWNKLHYWGLLELLDSTFMPTSRPTDLCRLTQRGQDFVYNNLFVSKTLWIHNHVLMAADSKVVNLQQALGRKHDMNHLLNERYEFLEQTNG